MLLYATWQVQEPFSFQRKLYLNGMFFSTSVAMIPTETKPRQLKRTNNLHMWSWTVCLPVTYRPAINSDKYMKYIVFWYPEFEYLGECQSSGQGRVFSGNAFHFRLFFSFQRQKKKKPKKQHSDVFKIHINI